MYFENVRTAWDIISDESFLEYQPEWVRLGQKLESKNGELIMYIVGITKKTVGTRVSLCARAGGGVPWAHEFEMAPWDVDSLTEYWRPV